MSEKFNNKTCGECKHYEVDEIAASCEKCCIICNDDAPACKHFKARVITNGDKIRQMNNKELAKVLSDGCPPLGGNSYKCKHPNPDFTCKDCWCDWLNAPAESEENNG